MNVIVHKIRLKPGVDPARFETWVETTDYKACPDLPSVQSFSVQRAASDPRDPFQYLEIIHITSRQAFERDMGTPLFQSLVEAFEQMAEVVEEISGERIGPGFRR